MSMLMLPSFLLAQNKKVALLETLNGDKSIQVKGIEMNMVRGELRKAISNQSGFQAFTRTDIDQLMKEHGFQNSGMVSDAQRKRLGEMSGADYICVSTLTKSDSQFYLEAYLIEVETGEISNPASQYGMLEGNTYANLFQLCQDLSKELTSYVGGSSSASPTQSPTPKGYVDLGLPSGTLWKAINEGMYDWDTAMRMYGDKIPSQGQWEELKDYCKWTWNGNGYKVAGPNGNSIVLPAAGFRNCDGDVSSVGSYGYYWSSTPSGAKEAWSLEFSSGNVGMYSDLRCRGFSVRLVQAP